MTRINKTLNSGVTYANWTIDRAFGIELAGIADPAVKHMLVAVFYVLTESQQLRILSSFGWETAPVQVLPAPPSP